MSILEELPFIIHHRAEFGWELFHRIFRQPQSKLWVEAEHLLYRQYRGSFHVVKSLLERIRTEAPDIAGEAYGHITTLAYLAGHVVTDGHLLSLATNEAIRRGIAQVLCANLKDISTAATCRGLLVGMFREPTCAGVAVSVLGRELGSDDSDATIDHDLLRQAVGALRSGRASDTWGFCKWLERNCARYPLVSLEVCEQLVALIGSQDGLRFSSGMVRVLLEILREADEADDPELVARAVRLQDEFLRIGVSGIEELLDGAAVG